MPEVLCLTGGGVLEGTVRVSGAKNSALPLLIASMLSSEECLLQNVPNLEDIGVTLRLLRSLGAKTSFSRNEARISVPTIRGTEAPYNLVKALRASFWVLGPLLARCGEARVSLPGGDAIGTRPVDLHLEALSRLGAEFRMKHGVVIGTAPGGLRGATINLKFPSVGATHHVLMTASLIAGETILHGAAREPEVVELAEFLCRMGAEVEGAGEGTIRIRGREELSGASYSVLGDRIEAATYLLSSATTGGSVRVEGVKADALRSTLELLQEAGSVVTVDDRGILLEGPERLKAISFETSPYPGVATDVQPLLMAAMVCAEGTSKIHETVFERRFGHVGEYRRFGANIDVEGRVALVKGVASISAAPVDALDIRAAAGLVLLGLVARGVTQIHDVYHLDRGYDGLLEKFKSLGASVARLPSMDEKELVVGC